MTHQVALTISAAVRPERRAALGLVLDLMAADPGGNPVIPFAQLAHTHFARVVLLEATRAQDDAPAAASSGTTPTTLLMTLDCDAGISARLHDLADVAASGLDQLLGACEGYPAVPTPRSRLGFLRAHLRSSTVFYVHAVGRTLAQVRDEARLRRALESYVDQDADRLVARTPAQVRDAILAHVAAEPGLAWALLPAPPPAWWWRLREGAHKVAVPALLVLTLPVGLPATLVWLLALRWHERLDDFPELLPDNDRLSRLGEKEDFGVQNAFTSLAPIRPGRFWQLTSRLTEVIGDYFARHVFTAGSLSGLTTVHFARFMRVDDGQVLFTSYYDGSLESYNNDFVDQVAWVLNTVFGQQAGFPRTRWMVGDGAHNERWFKDFIRGRQLPTQVWYSAYPDLAAVTIDQNARLRAGLSEDLDGEELTAWLSIL